LRTIFPILITFKQPTLVLGILAQIVRILLMSSVMALANQPDEAAEDSLLRWFNFHLKAANVSDNVTSFGELQVLS
jgi:hypothetical protein